VDLDRFWLPSGCGIPVAPMNEPCLISDSEAFTIATMSGLSVRETFISEPSRDLTT
jgi:hypothetical protein